MARGGGGGGGCGVLQPFTRRHMSELGQSRRFGDVCDMSALPPTTVVMMQCRERQKGANKRHMHRSKKASPFDHLGRRPAFAEREVMECLNPV